MGAPKDKVVELVLEVHESIALLLDAQDEPAAAAKVRDARLAVESMFKAGLLGGRP